MSESILDVSNLSKTFDGFSAVDDVSVEFSKNTTYAIIGPNGAGKTTFFNLITGVIAPSSGRILFNGEDITNLGPKEVARKKLIRSYQITQIFDSMTVLKNVLIAIMADKGKTYDFWSSMDDYPELRDKAEDILYLVGLSEQKDQNAGDLSHGEQRSLEIGIALGTEPRMLLLDEPTSGMSPEETRDVIEIIGEIAKTTPLIIIEHKMSVVRSVADQILVLHNGRKLASGSPDEVRSNEDVRRIYLGSDKL